MPFAVVVADVDVLELARRRRAVVKGFDMSGEDGRELGGGRKGVRRRAARVEARRSGSNIIYIFARVEGGGTWS